MKYVRPLVIAGGIIFAWQILVWLAQTPPYILPGPDLVAARWIERRSLILDHAVVTFMEIVLGLAIGIACGAVSAMTMAFFRPARAWLLPVLVVSQAIPVFTIGPVLVLWLGYGMASKVAMAVLIIYFPVTATFFDGLKRTEPGWLDLADTMGASRFTILLRIRVPAAMPAFSSGLRVAAAAAPIGAVVGEWVGSSAGLGYLMLHSNARMQIDLTFAALFTLALIAVAIFYTIDRISKRLVTWQPESGPAD